ncbi:MAG: hypothetical protein ACKORY_00805 [Actinomycetota bacterium]
MRGGIPHLVRRAVSSMRNNEPPAEGTAVARGILGDAEFAMWSSMQARDRRHSLDVLARFDALRPASPRPERAAALLHDVGKAASPLGWAGRVAARLFGGRTATMRTYLDHEHIGAAMLRGVSDPRTVELVGGLCRDDVSAALGQADDV